MSASAWAKRATNTTRSWRSHPGERRSAHHVAFVGVSDRIATHEQPPDADFLVHADLESHGIAGAREQLWVKRVADHRFLMRSLPFFTYGIALGDEVETDASLTIIRVARHSGHGLLRVTVERETAEQFHAEFHPFLNAESLVHEWRGLGYVSVDIPPQRDLSRLTDWLDSRAANGSLRYEDG